MYAHEEFLGQTLLPLEKTAQDEKVNTAGEVHFGVITGRKDRHDRLDLHDLEMMIDRKQQTIIRGERIVAAHTA